MTQSTQRAAARSRLCTLLTVAAAAATLSAWTAGRAFAAAEGAQPPAAHVSAAQASPEQASSPQAPTAVSPDHHWAFLSHYCVACHNVQDWAGGIAFDVLSGEPIGNNAPVLEKAVRKLEGHLMPPAGKRQPDAAAAHAFVTWLEGGLDRASLGHPDPGRVPLHRINRREYANAIHDLLGIDVDPSALLPKDNLQDGFDDIASALQITPSFLDQYVAAARTVAIEALGNRAAIPAGTVYRVENAGTQQFHEEGLPLGTRGGAAVEHFFPADGEYVLNIANMAQALWVYDMEFKNTIVVTLDGAEIYRTSIGGDEDMKAIDQKQDPAVDAINSRLKNIHFKARAGVHQLAVTYVRRTFAENEDRLEPLTPGGGEDRVLRLTSFEINGPFHVTGVSDSPSRERILVCQPATPAEEEPCAKRIVATLARRAFRRPLDEQDLRPLMGFYETGYRSGGFETGIREALTAILASPDFLFRSEFPLQPVAAGVDYRITDLDLASRLSFFLWGSVPDDELIDAASSGRLHDPQVLAAEVHRMLADPRAVRLTTDFAFQWLDVDRLDEIQPDGRVFPYASGAGDPREDYRTELKLFIDSVFRGDRSVLDLLDANYTFLNQRTALQYGINSVRGDQFRRVTLEPSQSARFGLLGKGAILMLTSYPTRTAPVLRGEWILDYITGTPPAAPPAQVPALKENHLGAKALSVRQRMEAHRRNPQCFACHGAMDPLGLALENFDATGRYRLIDEDTQAPVDAMGKLPDGTIVRGPDDLRKALLAQPQQFVQTLTEKLMTYALGRTLEYYDMPTVRGIVRASQRDGYRFSSIVTHIVLSDAFQKQRAAAGGDRPLATQTAFNQ